MLRAGVLAIMLAVLALPAVASADVYTLKVAPDEFDIRAGELDVATPAQVIVTENGGPVTQDTFVTVYTGDPNSLLVTGGGVTIPAGQTSAAIHASGIQQSFGDVTLDAELGSLSATANANVLGAAEVVPKMTVTPFDTPVVPVGSPQTLTAHFDYPGGISGAHVIWSVGGVNHWSNQTDVTTSSTTTSTFSYTGDHAGSDLITVCYDADADGACDNTKHAHVTWAAPAASTGPGALTFSDTLVGHTSPAQVVTLTNTGSVPLHVGAASLLEAAADQFSATADGCSSTTVAVGASCTISIAFAPTHAGTAVARLRIPDDSTTSPHDIALGGTGATARTDTQTPPVIPLPPPLPSNAVRIVKLTTKRRTGQLRVTVHTDTPGRLTLKAVRKGKTIASRTSRTKGGVNTTLSLKPKPTARKLLRRKHRLAAKLRVTFLPDGGIASSVARGVSFRLAR